jgi:hypothetical protein
MTGFLKEIFVSYYGIYPNKLIMKVISIKALLVRKKIGSYWAI